MRDTWLESPRCVRAYSRLLSGSRVRERGERRQVPVLRTQRVGRPCAPWPLSDRLGSSPTPAAAPKLSGRQALWAEAGVLALGWESAREPGPETRLHTPAPVRALALPVPASVLRPSRVLDALDHNLPSCQYGSSKRSTSKTPAVSRQPEGRRMRASTIAFAMQLATISPRVREARHT